MVELYSKAWGGAGDDPRSPTHQSLQGSVLYAEGASLYAKAQEQALPPKEFARACNT